MNPLRIFHGHLIRKNDQVLKLETRIQEKDIEIADFEFDLKVSQAERARLVSQLEALKSKKEYRATAGVTFLSTPEKIKPVLCGAINYACTGLKEGDTIWNKGAFSTEWKKRVLTRVRHLEDDDGIGYFIDDSGDEVSVNISYCNEEDVTEVCALPITLEISGDLFNESETVMLYERYSLGRFNF
jgi:hypothetical protein